MSNHCDCYYVIDLAEEFRQSGLPFADTYYTRCVHRNKEDIHTIVRGGGKGMIYAVLVMTVPSLVSLLRCKNVMFYNGQPGYAIS